MLPWEGGISATGTPMIFCHGCLSLVNGFISPDPIIFIVVNLLHPLNTLLSYCVIDTGYESVVNSEFELMLNLSESVGKIILTGKILDKTGLPSGIHRMVIEKISNLDRQKLVDYCMSLAK